MTTPPTTRPATDKVFLCARCHTPVHSQGTPLTWVHDQVAQRDSHSVRAPYLRKVS